MSKILTDDVFLKCSRCNKHKSNMSNKRINDPSLLLSKQKEKGNSYRSAVAKRRRTESVVCEKPEATVALLLEQVFKIL
jgi:hypothetical protein